ncbi:hypothetical protein [Microseira wollei]|uniref:Lipoyl synthase n=1 Tax=Microseira wollei NIES-4236 TaxID=2530354 RepID=A0AAV3XS17_9CYAN|nr:hypothetical protein [Microseira wollei]GET44638.1 hypothetical protein MiSe_94690 [Microseira wollei NIES-4236]
MNGRRKQKSAVVAFALALILGAIAIITPALLKQNATVSIAADDGLETRLSSLESRVLSLQSELYRIESQINQLSSSSTIPRESPRRVEVPLPPRSTRRIPSSDPMFARLSTLVIEQKERLDRLEARIARLERAR